MSVMMVGVHKELQRNCPNISGIEIGLKRKNGMVTDTLAFRVIVKNKVNETALTNQQIIPKEIKGIPTDVLTEHHGIATSNDDGYDLMTGGIQIDSGAGHGTLGCFVTRDAEPAEHKKIYLLSNHHVIVGKSGTVGTRVGQPSSPSGSKCCLCYDVAEVFAGERGSPTGKAITTGTVLTPAGAPNTIDAGIAKLLGQDAADPKTVYFSNSIEGIGPVFGAAPAALLPGDVVRKSGAKTGLTYGKVEVSTNAVFREHDKEDNSIVIDYPNILIISPLAENPSMQDGGDSGAVLVNRLNQVVGLTFAAPVDFTAPAISVKGPAIAFPIAPVLTRLGISVLSSGTPNSIPLSGISEAKINPIRAGNYVHKFEQRMRSIPNGEIFLQILLDHRNEVMDLINDNREVKFAWHRFNGPEYIGHVLKNASHPEHPVPADINGYSLQNLLIKMSDVLERHGSDKLEKAVNDYSSFAFSFANQYNGIGCLENALQHFPLCPKCGKPIHMNAHAD